MKFRKLERNDVMIRYMHVDFHFEKDQIEKKIWSWNVNAMWYLQNETILSFYQPVSTLDLPVQLIWHTCIYRDLELTRGALVTYLAVVVSLLFHHPYTMWLNRTLLQLLSLQIKCGLNHTGCHKSCLVFCMEWNFKI